MTNTTTNAEQRPDEGSQYPPLFVRGQIAILVVAVCTTIAAPLVMNAVGAHPVTAVAATLSVGLPTLMMLGLVHVRVRQAKWGPVGEELFSFSDDGKWMTVVRPTCRGYLVWVRRIGHLTYEEIRRGDGSKVSWRERRRQIRESSPR